MTEGEEVECRTLDEFPGYRFGSDGSVWSRMKMGRSSDFSTTWRRRKLKINPVSGYQEVIISDLNLVKKTCRIHTLICTAFHGPCQAGMECCHYDGVRTNNQPSNLRWDTKKGNWEDSFRLGTVRRGERHHAAKLRESDIPVIQELIKQGWPQVRIAAQFGVTGGTIWDIANGKSWRHLTQGVSGESRTGS